MKIESRHAVVFLTTTSFKKNKITRKMGKKIRNVEGKEKH